MPEPDDIARALHRLRSTLMRLRLEVELSASLSEDDAMRLLVTIGELRALESRIGHRAPKAIEVIIIEDDEELGQLLVTGLQRAGHVARAVTDVKQASHAASSQSVLVLDLSAIDDAPADAIRWLRARRPIILTGASATRARDIAAMVDASAVLSKPVTAVALADAVTHVAEATLK